MQVRLAPPYQGRCLFCLSKRKLTDEDVISRAVRRLLPRVTSVQAVAGGTLVGKPSNVLHVVLKNAVCTRCNNRWMSGLENAFVRTLGTQLSSPAKKTLDPSQQERVARWAAKTALLMTLWTGEQRPKGAADHYVPDAHLRWLPTHATPPPGTRVWMGILNDPNERIVHHQSAWLAVEPTKPVAYLVTFSLGYLLFQVFGTLPVDDRGGGTTLPILDPPAPFDRALTNIWPGNGQDAVWPTAMAIPAATLNRVAQWPRQLIEQPPTTPAAAGSL